MSRTMIQAAVTMNQIQNKLDLIGNNMANSQTTGYKSRNANFSSMLFQQINNMSDPANAEGRVTPNGVRVGSGSKLGAINLNLNKGTLMETGRELDLALLGENSLFQIEVTKNGLTETQYTRDGSFYLNPTVDNQSVMLTTKDGYPVIGVNGPITIEAGFDSIQISAEGQITVGRGGQTEYAGQLATVQALRPRLLEATGGNAFRLPDLAALGLNLNEIMQMTNLGTEMVMSGTLESSNVDISEQMTDMITAQRSYQFNARTISMGDQMLGLINQLR